jgi:FkbM family methyltransferase
MTDDVLFRCPRSSLGMISSLPLEYPLPSFRSLHAPTILDLGGHVGGFAWYALQRWPDGEVFSYEPHPETFRLLVENVQGLKVTPHNVAVVHPRPPGKLKLFEGVASEGRHACSLRDDLRWPHVSQDYSRWVEVETLDAAELPPADVIKCDTEGSEVEILTGYRHLPRVFYLLVEVHAVGGDSDGQANKIRALAMTAGMRELPYHGGVLVFTR